MHPLDDDIGAVLYAGDEIADAVTWAGDPFSGFLNLGDASVLEGRAQAADAELLYPARIVLSVGTEVVVRGKRYRVVADPERVGDGREMIATLRAI